MEVRVSDASEERRVMAELTRKLEEFEQNNRKLSTFLETSRQIATSLDMDAVLSSIVELASRLLQADYSHIRLWNEEKNLLEMVKTYNLTDEYKIPMKPGQGISGRCFQEGRPITVEEVLKDPRTLSKDLLKNLGISSMLCVPIFLEDKTIGILALFTREVRKFTEKEIFLLSGFADQAALAIEKSRIYEKLRQSEEKYRTFIESIDVPCFELDLAGNFTFVNEALCRFSGYSRDKLIGLNNRDYMDEDTARKVYKAFNRVCNTGEPMRGLVYEVITKDGSKKFMETYASLIRNQTGEGIGFRGIARDITERRDLLRRMARAEKGYKRLFEAVNDAIFLVNRQGYFTTFNKRFLRMTGFNEKEIRNIHFLKLVHPEDLPLVENEFRKAMGGERAVERLTFRSINKKGKIDYVEGVFRLMKGGNQITGTLGVLRDITEKVKMEKELRELAITDDLTGLYNQRHFYRELEKEIERSKRQGSDLSLILFDLDYFKAYNDTYGHLEGDKVLKKVAQASLKSIRKIDSAFRYGGDEFTVILPGAGVEDAVLVGERLRKSCLETPFLQPITLSIGLVQFRHQYNLSTFIKYADDAMYSAKKMGGNTVYVIAQPA